MSDLAAFVLLMINDLEDRRRSVQQIATEVKNPMESDKEVDQVLPVLDSFYNISGDPSIRKMISKTRFYALWNIAHVPFKSPIMSRGRKNRHSPMDLLFMALCVLEHAADWNYNASMFRFKTSAFE